MCVTHIYIRHELYMYMSQNVCSYVTCTNIRHELYMVMSHICIFIFHRYKNTSRTATPPDDDKMPHSNGAIYISHICIFICHTSKNTSRTATPPHDNEMPHSHGAIYISHICIFIRHTCKYTSRTANVNERCFIHVGPFICTFKKRVSIGLLRICRALWRIHRSLLRIYKALWRIHRSLLRCVCWVMGCLIHVGLILWGHPHRKSSCIFTRYVIYDKYDVIHRSLLRIYKALWRIHRSLLRCVCWAMGCHTVCHTW